MGQLLHIRPPYYMVHRMAPERWAVVHAIAGAWHNPSGQPLVSVDVDGFHTAAAAEAEATWMNAERDAEQQRLADERRAGAAQWGRHAG